MGQGKKLIQRFDWIVIAYALTVIAYQILLLIAPIKGFLYNTGFEKISSAFAVLGLLIFLYDLFTERIFLKSKYSYTLLITILILCISSLIYVKWGIANNLKVIIWQVSQMLVIYPLYKRISGKGSYKLFYIFHSAISAIFIPAVLVSLYQFFSRSAYTVTVDKESYRQGFMEGRLFGVFSSIYFASLFITIMLISSIFFAFKTKKTLFRTIHIIEGTIYFLYIVLSETRSVLVGIFISIFIFVFIMTKDYLVIKIKKLKNLFMRHTTCVVVAVLAVVLTNSTINLTDSLLKNISVPYGGYLSKKDMNLDRPDIEGIDVSNHRFKIWSDYIKVTSKDAVSFLVGKSPGNYMNIIKEEFPDVYIVTYIREKFPDMFEKGLIYDTHNSYLSVYVTTGILGVIALGTFFVLWIRRVLIHIFRNKRASAEFLVLTSLLVAIIVSAFFDSDLFFKCTDTSVIMWLLMGLMMKVIDKESESSLAQS